MTKLYTSSFQVGWGDLDFNAHMRNTAYLDLAATTRMLFFKENGFSMREFERLRIGPVVMRDELDYYRELRLLEQVRVTLAVAGLSEDGSRFCLCNEFFREDGQRAARVLSTGGWLDQAARRLTAPPPALIEVMASLEPSEDFVRLPSSLS